MFIFIENKYTHWYNNIISTAKTRNLNIDGYYEKHHIIPRSLDGIDSNDNIVSLTAREHYICHLLLVKMTTGRKRHKMIFAAHMLSNRLKSKIKINARLYEKTKLLHRESISEKLKGKPWSEKRRAAHNPEMKRLPISEETRQRLSEARKGKTIEQILGSEEKAQIYRRKQSEAREGKKLDRQQWNKDLTGHLSVEARNNASSGQLKRTDRMIKFIRGDSEFIFRSMLHGTRTLGLSRAKIIDLKMGRLDEYDGWRIELIKKDK